MSSIRLDPVVAARLERLAKESKQSKNYHAALAIQEYLDDREDYLSGMAALERNEDRVRVGDLERELGMDQ